jgi:hypothetical protein
MGKSDIIRQNQDKEAMLGRSLKKLVELYSDKIHFIYELIQNAEDARADCICFRRYSDRLEVFHNGNPFTDSNLQSLCDAALSDKESEDDMIGKFGLGFKSVFTICNVVKLYSEPSNHPIYNDLESFAIRIENYIDPTDIDNKWDHENIYTTKFIFPYHVDDKFFNTVDKIKEGIAKKLRNLGADVLLFLKNIKKIEYVIYNDVYGENIDGKGFYTLERKLLGDNFFKVTPPQDQNDSSYFIFSKNIKDTKRSVDIAFPIIEKDGRGRFVKSNSRYISVYFPTEIESHLNFIVQAPFDVTPNRSSLIENSGCNKNLFLLLAELLKEALFTFKNKNILSLELISLLPYKVMDSMKNGTLLKQDLHIADMLDITEMLKTEEIIPTIDGKYVTRKNAKIVRSKELIELFEGDKLCALLNQDGAKWLSRNFTENNQQLRELHYFFKKELKVKEIGSEELAQLIEDNPDFLKKADDKWLVKFYNYLSNNVPKLLEKSSKLVTVPFIKTIDGNFNAPFVKPEGGKMYEAKSNIFLRPKSAISNVEGFLFVDNFIEQNCPELIKALDIKKPNELEYFIRELETGKNIELNDNTNVLQVKQAVQCLKSDPEKVIDLFKNLLWIKVIDTYGKTKFITCSNGTIYGEKDFCGVSIKEYFGDINCNIYILNERFYLDNGLTPNDLEVLEKLGIKNDVYEKLDEIYFEENIDGRGRPANCRNIDNFRKNLSFYNIGYVLRYIKECSTDKTTEAKQKTKIIFDLLKNVEEHLQGAWQRGEVKKEEIPGTSKVVEVLKNIKWLFDKNGSIVSPSEISRYDLDIDIYGKINEKTNIYEILGFKKTGQDKQLDVMQKILSLLKQFNIPLSSNNLKQIELIIQNSIHEDVDDIFNPKSENNNDPFLNQPIKNLQFIQKWIKKQYDEASETEYKYLQRHIRTSRRINSERKNIGKRYHGYCQICHKRRLYWDVTEIFENPKKELEQMNLSLCPNCASEYRQWRKDENLMSSFKTKILDANPEKDIVIMLGEKTVKFTNTHLAEIQEILKLEKD